MKNNAIDLILIGKFDEAKATLGGLQESEIGKKILYFACVTRSLVIYGFVIHELMQAEKAFWHYIAAEMLLAPLCFITGSYALGAYHARRAIQLEPKNIEHKQLLLAFHTLPDPVINKEEAIQLAKEIVAVDPKIESAIRILNKYEI